MKKYLLILLGFLMAVLYLHPASVLAEDVQKIAVTYQYIDEDTGEIFKEEKRNTDKQAGKAYEATPRWEEKYGLEKKEVVQERIDGDSGTAYMFDLGHSKNVLKIEHLSENSEENVIQLYYKAYHLADSDHTCVDVTIMDEDADVVIKKETFEVKKSDHFYYDIDFIIKDEQGISYRYDSQSTENRERVFRANENVEERVMDSNDLERERGITILSKPTAVMYNGINIIIVDTPGHADFGGEVERILQMVDGVVLLVDAFEGCMPQTRFVLKKALGLGKKPLVVLNKIDRPGARPEEVVDEVLDLFIELGADEDQLEFPVIYASARDGYASEDYHEPGTDMKPLFDAIVKEIPAPQGDMNGGLQLLISNIDSDKFVGRIGVGRVERGTAKNGQAAVLCHTDGTTQNVRIAKLYQFEGLKRVECDTATLGDIVCISGVQDINIGETICSNDCVEPLPFVKIDEPTVSMNFIVNNSPFAGREGKYVTSRNLRDRLFKEIETNVALRVEETDSADTFKVSGRGELHLSILIETMRRQNYEFQVSRPQVITKMIDGKLHEPMEFLIIEVPDT